MYGFLGRYIRCYCVEESTFLSPDLLTNPKNHNFLSGSQISMAFPPMWCRAKRSRLLSWTTPGESQRLFLASWLGCLWFWFSQGDVWLKWVCFFVIVSAMRWISSMKTNMLKTWSVLLLPFVPSMSFKSKLSGKLQWISRWWFQLNTCFWMMCFGTLHQSLGNERWDQVEASFFDGVAS